VRRLLVVLSVAGFLGAVVLAVAFLAGRAPGIVLRLIACLVAMDHAALTALYVIQPMRVQMLGLLLYVTAPLTVIAGLAGIVAGTRAGALREGGAPVEATTVLVGLVLLALGALTVVFLAREGGERPSA